MSLRISVGVTRVLGRRDDMASAVSRDIQNAGLPLPFVTSYDDIDGGNNLGPYGNFRKCLAAMIKLDIQREQSSDAYLILQDDIRLSANLVPLLNKEWQNFNRVGCISLYCATPHHREQIGWFPLDPCEGRRSYGALAMMMPQAAAIQFLQNPPNPGCKTRTCFWVAEWCRQMGLSYWLHSPSFVMHTGRKSLVDSGFDDAPAVQNFRQAAAFAPDAAKLTETIDPRQPSSR